MKCPKCNSENIKQIGTFAADPIFKCEDCGEKIKILRLNPKDYSKLLEEIDSRPFSGPTDLGRKILEAFRGYQIIVNKDFPEGYAELCMEVKKHA